MTTAAEHPTSEAPILLTVDEAAERLRIGRSLVYALMKEGELESVRIGRLRRIPVDALPRFLRRLQAIQANADAEGRE